MSNRYGYTGRPDSQHLTCKRMLRVEHRYSSVSPDTSLNFSILVHFPFITLVPLGVGALFIHFTLPSLHFTLLLSSHRSITCLVTTIMASEDSGDGLDAPYIAPRSSSATRSYNTNLSATQHRSSHSHMMPPPLHVSSMSPNAGNPDRGREPKITAEDNTQPRFELFLLGDGEKKVTEEADTRKFSCSPSCKTTNARCFHVNLSNPRESS